MVYNEQLEVDFKIGPLGIVYFSEMDSAQPVDVTRLRKLTNVCFEERHQREKRIAKGGREEGRL